MHPAPGPATLVLTATVARRYYLDGASKSDIAAELGLSRFKVARLLEKARTAGIVRIELDSPGHIDLDLSVRLRAAFNLQHSVVVDGPDDDEQLLRGALGRAAAELLSEIVQPGDVLGIAWARSVMSMRTALTSIASCDVVQLTGALSQPRDESPIELVRDVARCSGGQAFFYHAPMILPDAATARVLRTQPEVARAIHRFPDVTKAVVGVGGWEVSLSTAAAALSEAERAQLAALGVRAELSGVLLDGEGRPLATPLSRRLIAIAPEQLHAVPEIIGLVYGVAKARAVRAALHGRFLTSVVTHSAMARELLGAT
jgi:DNA-binding transcriptional regulator LsrR (DeoR family)